MKKCFRFLTAVLVLPVMLGAVSCSDDVEENNGGSSEPALSFNYVTKNRGFIGGSVIYNPNGTNNQLEAGTKLGIRLGYLQTNYATVTQLEGVDFDSTDEITIDIDENGGQTITGGTVTSHLLIQQVSEDIPNRAHYGFLDITSVDEDKISFSATIFSADGKSHTTISKTIATGEGCDLNGDDNDDLKYDVPPIKRTDYDNARWLTFICDESSAHTTMYFTFTKAERDAGYRSAAESDGASTPEEGFYGVNSDGRFIFLQKTSNRENGVIEPSAGAVFGDFVLGMDKDTKTFGSELDENDVKATDIEGAAQTDAVATQTSVNANSYTVIGSSGSNALDFESYTYAYNYAKSQFPDQENGPKDLLEKLVATADKVIGDKTYSVKNKIKALNNDSDTLPVTVDKQISLLNNILSDEDTVKTIAYANGLKDNYDGLVADTTITISGQKYARRIIDKCYTQSPKADIKSPDIANIYPFAFANVGSVLDSDYSAARSVYYDDVSSARSVSSSYDDFKKKRDTINKKWSEFSSLYIKKATWEDENHKKKTINFKNDLGLELAGGLKGGCSISGSKTQVDLGAVIYVNLDASAEQLANNGLKILMSGFKLGIPDTQIQIGPVPVVYGCAVVIGFNFSASINPHLCFIGMYGGETSFGATYGIKYKWGFIPYPYFDTFGSGNKICETEAFIGFDTSKKFDVTWGPWVTVSPSVGLGWSSLSVRGSVPVTASFEMTNEFPTFKIKKAALGLKVQVVPYFELSVLKIIHIRKDFGKWTVVDGKLVFIPAPVHWE